MEFLGYFLKLLLYTLGPILSFGLSLSLCDWLFCRLVGDRSGEKLLVGAHLLPTPLREFGHLTAAVLSFHRVGDFCLLTLHDPEGELGFVEHSYNPRNPVAILGNFFFAVFPAAMVLFAVFVVTRCLFAGCFEPFLTSVSELEATGAGPLAFLRAVLAFPREVFSAAHTGIPAKIIGCVLLLFLSLGAYVSLSDLRQSVGGLFLFVLLVFLFSAVTAIFDDRLRNLICESLHTFALSVTALYLIIFLFAGVLLALAALFFLIRGLFSLDRPGGRFDQ